MQGGSDFPVSRLSCNVLKNVGFRKNAYLEKETMMKLTTSGRARLYAITSTSCIVWLIQSVIEANEDGTLFSYATIILSLCLVFVSGYCAFNAIRDWNVKDNESKHKSE